jgi:hypothetical protein
MSECSVDFPRESDSQPSSQEPDLAATIAAATAATVSSRGAIRSRATMCDTLLTLGGARTLPIPQPATAHGLSRHRPIG